MAAAEHISSIEKVRLLRRTLRNWPLVVLDKLGLVRCVTYETRSHMRMTCRTRSSDVNEAVAIFSGLEYPTTLLHMTDDAVVLDGGANLGAFSLLVAGLNPSEALRIVAFEPFAPNAKLLRHNLRLNGENRVTVEEIALGGCDGEAHLDTSRNYDEVAITQTQTSTIVPIRRLSTYCTETGLRVVELLKLDIEGGEYDVIHDDLEWIERHVERLLVEYHNTSNGPPSQFLFELLEKSFEVELLHSGAATGVLHARRRSELGCSRDG